MCQLLEMLKLAVNWNKPTFIPNLFNAARFSNGWYPSLPPLSMMLNPFFVSVPLSVYLSTMLKIPCSDLEMFCPAYL